MSSYLCLTWTLAMDVCTGEFVQVLNKGDLPLVYHFDQPATVRIYNSAYKYVTYRSKETLANATALCHRTGRNRLWLVCPYQCHSTLLWNRSTTMKKWENTSTLRNRRMELFPLQRKQRAIPNLLKKKSFMCTVAATYHGTDTMLMMTQPCATTAENGFTNLW